MPPRLGTAPPEPLGAGGQEEMARDSGEPEGARGPYAGKAEAPPPGRGGVGPRLRAGPYPRGCRAQPQGLPPHRPASPEPSRPLRPPGLARLLTWRPGTSKLLEANELRSAALGAWRQQKILNVTGRKLPRCATLPVPQT
nr:proline-rich protein HaeIII subfamily 1 isoform X1 [Oryctolagus cuniculus]